MMSSEDTSPPAHDRSAPADKNPVEVLTVQQTEGGQKLLQFLQRRFSLPPAMLHRWVRTGQVRINGGRCKPFARVQTGDTVRLPPFALKMAAERVDAPSASAPELLERQEAAAPDASAALPPMVGTDGYLWAFNKPAGLPTHPGTGHHDSLSTRLARHFASAPFKPTPVHRLDKDTSGLLLVAASYEALVTTQAALRRGSLVKEYVAWVCGRWPHPAPRLLRHHLRKEYEQAYEKVRLAAPHAPDGKEALCLVRPLCVRERESLLLVRLLTGRTHQIRAQLAAVGHPVLGDAKYGHAAGQKAAQPLSGKSRPAPQQKAALLLHALRVTLPCGAAFACLPPWRGEHALHSLPEPPADTAEADAHKEAVPPLPGARLYAVGAGAHESLPFLREKDY